MKKILLHVQMIKVLKHGKKINWEYKLKKYKNAHSSSIRKVKFRSNGNLISCSWDNSVKNITIWK